MERERERYQVCTIVFYTERKVLTTRRSEPYYTELIICVRPLMETPPIDTDLKDCNPKCT